MGWGLCTPFSLPTSSTYSLFSFFQEEDVIRVAWTPEEREGKIAQQNKESFFIIIVLNTHSILSQFAIEI